jgi:threonine aldolase
MAAWSGAVPRVLRGVNGVPTPEQVAAAVAPAIYYMAPTALLVLENSQNHAGGGVLEPAAQAKLLRVAHDRGVKVHLDGARIFNAAAALGVSASALARGVDSVMFCLSKGLGAPVGSMLCGSAELITEARVVRKRMGGGLRQVGVLAAAGLYALEHHVERLVDDQRRARRLAGVLAELPCFEIDPGEVRTNIVIAGLRPADATDRLLESLRERGVLAGAMGQGRIRFVTHLDVDDAGLERACAAIRAVGSSVQ